MRRRVSRCWPWPSAPRRRCWRRSPPARRARAAHRARGCGGSARLRTRGVALDEGVDDEACAPLLLERLALQVDLDAVPLRPSTISPGAAQIRARASAAGGHPWRRGAGEPVSRHLALGIDSPRAALLAARGALPGGDCRAEARWVTSSSSRCCAWCCCRGRRACLHPPERRARRGGAAGAAGAGAGRSRRTHRPRRRRTAPRCVRRSEDDGARAPDPLDGEQILDAAQALLPANLLARLAAGKGRARARVPAASPARSSDTSCAAGPWAACPAIRAAVRGWT
jgi:magnesium chelatase subunit D